MYTAGGGGSVTVTARSVPAQYKLFDRDKGMAVYNPSMFTSTVSPLGEVQTIPGPVQMMESQLAQVNGIITVSPAQWYTSLWVKVRTAASASSTYTLSMKVNAYSSVPHSSKIVTSDWIAYQPEPFSCSPQNTG